MGWGADNGKEKTLGSVNKTHLYGRADQQFTTLGLDLQENIVQNFFL